MEGWEVISGATPEEYGKLCSDRKRSTEQGAGDRQPTTTHFSGGGTIHVNELDGCHYYATLLSRGTEEARDHLITHTPSGTGFTTWSRENGFCPYELSKALCKDAHVVIAPYVTFFQPSIREALLRWMGKPLEEIDVVIDEAHNLPDYLRELASYRMTEESVTRAIREIEVNGGVELEGGGSATKFLSRVRAVITGLADDLPEGDEGLIPEGVLEERLLEGTYPTSQRLEEAFLTLSMWGEALKDARRKQKLLPRSYASNVANFMLSLQTLGPPEHLKVVTKAPVHSLILYSLDATKVARPATETHLTVHMSGTLAPLDEYRDSLGLPSRAGMLVAPPSFPPENRRLFVSGRATTRYADLERDGGMEALKDEILSTLKVLPVKTAVFFPSFALLRRMVEVHLKDELEEWPRKVVVESQGLSSEDLHDLVHAFKRSTDARVLLGVCGGRISEGTDFPNEELGAVVLAGIPYPRPTARRDALTQYMEMTVGNGWEHCYAAPARRTMVQALGRMIRSETDRGIGVILDTRAERFTHWFGKLERMDALPQAVATFFPVPLSEVARNP
jgi:DNA excision repair protein ERCC-2